jgi:hypothetical protein
MSTLHKIYSMVAMDINDLQFVKIPKAEYISIASQVSEQITREASVFITKKDFIAPADDTHEIIASPVKGLWYYIWTSPNANGDVMPDIARILNRDPKTDLDAPYSVTTESGIPFNPIHIMKMFRGNVEMREVSWKAVSSWKYFNQPFKTNDSELDQRHYAVLFQDNVLRFVFATPLAKDETISAWFSCRFNAFDQDHYSGAVQGGFMTPHWTMFEDHTPIPEIMEIPFYKGMRKEAIEKLAMREGDIWLNRLSIAQNEFNAELIKLKKYITNLKDKNSFPQIQPLKWLSDYGSASDYRSTGNPNVEHYSNIII